MTLFTALLQLGAAGVGLATTVIAIRERMRDHRHDDPGAGRQEPASSPARARTERGPSKHRSE